MLYSLLHSMIACVNKNPLVGDGISVLDIQWNDTDKTVFVWNVDEMVVGLTDADGEDIPRTTHPDRLTLDDMFFRLDQITWISLCIDTLPLCLYSVPDNRCNISDYHFTDSDKVVQQLRTLNARRV